MPTTQEQITENDDLGVGLIPEEWMGVPEAYLRDITEAMEAVNGPMPRWAGQCHSLACQFAEALRGFVVRGYWVGPVHRESLFHMRPFAQHSWVELESGWIVDPTQWAFDHPKSPMVYCGPQDHRYVIGKDALRAWLHGHYDLPECPAFDVSEKVNKLEFPEHSGAAVFCRHLSGWRIRDAGGSAAEATNAQLMWLANRDVQILQPFARQIYEALGRLGLQAMVPLDNFRYVMTPRPWMR